MSDSALKSSSMRSLRSEPEEEATSALHSSNCSSDEFESDSRRRVAVPTSRLRRKRISRSKGGAFGDQKNKKRLYIIAYSSEIDIQGLSGSIGQLNVKWYSKCMADVLYLSLIPHDDRTEPSFDYNSQEVFIFEFGAMVAWGFSLKSINLKNIMNMIRKTSLKDPLLTMVEDEMGYVLLSTPAIPWSPQMSPISPSETPHSGQLTPEDKKDCNFDKSEGIDDVTISDEVITLNKKSKMVIRLSVSYAVAQSIIVSAFEDDVANKIQEYKYIPTVLAKDGFIKLRLFKCSKQKMLACDMTTYIPVKQNKSDYIHDR